MIPKLVLCPVADRVAEVLDDGAQLWCAFCDIEVPSVTHPVVASN